MKEDVLPAIYFAAAMATTLYLSFFDGYSYTWWNWLIAVPVNLFLGSIWPVYWGLLHWIM